MERVENVSYQLEIDQIRNATEAAAEELREEIRRSHHPTAFFIVLCVALLKDFGEGVLTLFIIGLIASPILGLAIDLFLRHLMKKYGWFETKAEVVKKIKFVFYGLSFFFDNLPAIGALPLTTITVFYIHHQIKNRGKEAVEELAELEYRMSQEVERVREQIEEETRRRSVEETEFPEETESETSRKEQATQSSVAMRHQAEETGTEKPTNSRNQTGENTEETPEEIFIPQEVRDPLGKLKRDYFETSPDQPRETPEKDSSEKTGSTPHKPKSKMDLTVENEDRFRNNKAA